ARGALARDELFVPIKERLFGGEGAQRGRVRPQAAPAALLALIAQPVVVALVDDVAFGSVQGRGADPRIQLEEERRFLLGYGDRRHFDAVAGALQRGAGNLPEYALLVA